MASSKLAAISTLIIVCQSMAQMAPAGPAFRLHDGVDVQNGMVKLTVSSPRPVEQGISAIRREFGLLLDYEEGPSTYAQVNGNRAHSIKSGGQYVIQVPETSLTGASGQERFVKDLVDQFYAQAGLSFTVLPGVNGRLTVAPSAAWDRLLDTPIILKPERRTIDQTVEAILGQVSKQRGVSIVRGGLVDNGLENRTVVVGSATEVVARSLLAQALDGAFYRKYWLFGWDSTSGNYVLAIQTALKVERTATGDTIEVPLQ